MNDGIAWLAEGGTSGTGYCVTLARGLEPEELVRRLARDSAPVSLGQYTGYDLDTYLDQRERERRRSDSVAVRYGASGDLAFAVTDGYWPGEMPTGPLLGASKDDARVFRLYYESQNPKLPPPEFSYFHDGRYMCGFDMYMHTWSHEITGTSPELVQEAVLAAGIPDEPERDVAHAKSLDVVERTFRLSLPREQVLHGKLPSALIQGQASA
ncbi:DUF6461 domain-containing protein [Streptomyces sp. AM 4-1-1]|uniref:DUF6461 domain-containing protein n=1 Tax=Streptomyces sp. AM 4-1-1 TaxID=3028710 RepID=UPI0023B896DA|nr:DUF6461 domain-containing protein [Streptomyces sp. AM 4-1-1]WEH33394.1 DUF6461 domain-containing protein [Streptomyces sp. AM 4-1-1]